MLDRYATVRAFAPTLLNCFAFLGSSSVTPLLRALDVIRVMHAAGRRTLPDKPPTGFIRRSWRPFVIKKDGIDRKAYEICALSELRDRLRAGDVWVEESRQSRDFESCLMPRATFNILREEGALPVAVPRSVERHLAERGVELDRIIAEVAGLAEKGGLEDVDLSDGELRVTPIRDTTPQRPRNSVAAPTISCHGSRSPTFCWRWTAGTSAMTPTWRRSLASSTRIATLRIAIARMLARTLQRCPCCPQLRTL